MIAKQNTFFVGSLESFFRSSISIDVNLFSDDFNVKNTGKMVLFQLSRSPTGLELRLKFPCESNLLNIVKLNLNKLFMFQYGRFPGEYRDDVQIYKMDIGVFQTTLLSFCITLSMTFLFRIIKSICSFICP